ncbi:hypothetical protein [Streptomyces sp. NBC_00343]|uniref:hypothetical protein n=1 Tax=Streptomyces sp. NBC_00343 TaxID=2975719 RepID=UPI002E28F7CF|nr:hypothetical protein [Streptomyces sp. NBC_00343]
MTSSPSPGPGTAAWTGAEAPERAAAGCCLGPPVIIDQSGAAARGGPASAVPSTRATAVPTPVVVPVSMRAAQASPQTCSPLIGRVMPPTAASPLRAGGTGCGQKRAS